MIISLFEPDSQVILNAKAHQPNEFADWCADEWRTASLTDIKVLERNAADTGAFLPALEHHQSVFGQLPEMSMADRGFFSAQNEREAKK